LLVFLTPSSVESKWVKKEIATGLALELGKKKGLEDKFVIPILLKPCEVPVMLLDNLYADFTNKSFESACEETYRGVINKSIGVQDVELRNKFTRVTKVQPLGNGKYGLMVEFGVEVSPLEGGHVGVKLSNNYSDVKQWFGKPNQKKMPENFGAFMMTGPPEKREPPIYARRFSSPNITSTKSYYLYFEGDEPLEVIGGHFLGNDDDIP